MITSLDLRGSEKHCIKVVCLIIAEGTINWEIYPISASIASSNDGILRYSGLLNGYNYYWSFRLYVVIYIFCFEAVISPLSTQFFHIGSITFPLIRRLQSLKKIPVPLRDWLIASNLHEIILIVRVSGPLIHPLFSKSHSGIFLSSLLHGVWKVSVFSPWLGKFSCISS